MDLKRNECVIDFYQLIDIKKSDLPIFIDLSIDKSIPIFIDWLFRENSNGSQPFLNQYLNLNRHRPVQNIIAAALFSHLLSRYWMVLNL